MGLLIRLGIIWALAGLIMTMQGCAFQCKTWSVDEVKEETTGTGFLKAATDWMFTDSTKKRG